MERICGLLHEKMDQEQGQYRKELLQLSPEEILENAYEYAVRNDILAALNQEDALSAEQAAALCLSPHLQNAFGSSAFITIGLKEATIHNMKSCSTLIETAAQSKRSPPLFGCVLIISAGKKFCMNWKKNRGNTTRVSILAGMTY